MTYCAILLTTHFPFTFFLPRSCEEALAGSPCKSVEKRAVSGTKSWFTSCSHEVKGGPVGLEMCLRSCRRAPFHCNQAHSAPALNTC
jgi:hypothetical protein